MNASFIPRAIGTCAKRLATSLVAEVLHVFLPHSTKLSGSKRLNNLIHFLIVLPPHIVHWHIVYVHYVAIRLLAAMVTNPVLHPFQNLLFSFCTFCLVGIMIIYCSSCPRSFGDTAEVFERSSPPVFQCCHAQSMCKSNHLLTNSQVVQFVSKNFRIVLQVFSSIRVCNFDCIQQVQCMV